jgi:hypothetical protein
MQAAWAVSFLHTPVRFASTPAQYLAAEEGIGTEITGVTRGRAPQIINNTNLGEINTLLSHGQKCHGDKACPQRSRLPAIGFVSGECRAGLRGGGAMAFT